MRSWVVTMSVCECLLTSSMLSVCLPVLQGCQCNLESSVNRLVWKESMVFILSNYAHYNMLFTVVQDLFYNKI